MDSQYISSNIKDTTHFLNQLRKLPTLPNNTLLDTMDVTALCTNILHTNGIRAVQNIMQNNNIDSTLTHWTLQCSECISAKKFVFNGQNYSQRQDTAIGTKMASKYANIFMHSREQKLLSRATFNLYVIFALSMTFG